MHGDHQGPPSHSDGGSDDAPAAHHSSGCEFVDVVRGTLQRCGDDAAPVDFDGFEARACPRHRERAEARHGLDATTREAAT